MVLSDDCDRVVTSCYNGVVWCVLLKMLIIVGFLVIAVGRSDDRVNGNSDSNDNF